MMTFHIYDFSEYGEELWLVSEDYEHDYFVPVHDCWDEERETWDEERVKEKAESGVKARFGADAVMVWGD